MVSALRVGIVGTGFAGEGQHTLDVAGGRGYVRLLDHDLPRRAMLLEPLGMPMNRTGYKPDRQLATVAAVLPQIWALPLDHRSHANQHWAGEPVDKAASLLEPVARLWHHLDRPCPERVIAQAIDFAHQRSQAFSPDRMSSCTATQQQPTSSRFPCRAPAPKPDSCSSTPALSSVIRPTILVSLCVTGAPSCSLETLRLLRDGGAAGSPPPAASTRSPSGNGDTSSECQQVCTPSPLAATAVRTYSRPTSSIRRARATCNSSVLHRNLIPVRGRPSAR